MEIFVYIYYIQSTIVPYNISAPAFDSNAILYGAALFGSKVSGYYGFVHVGDGYFIYLFMELMNIIMKNA